MSYAGQGLYNGQQTPPTYSNHAPSGGQYPQHQTPKSTGSVNTSPAIKQVNSRYDPRFGPINGSHQHRPLHPQNLQQAPQRAYAVAIPPPSIPPDSKNRYIDSHPPKLSRAPSSQNPAKAVNGHAVKPAPKPVGAEPPVDYQVLLLSLAEEYLAAAYNYGSMADIRQREPEVHAYYKLIATGLGCLEAVLRHVKLVPERECNVRLRYATILYEETDNTMEAEEALSKGISLADRHHFYDLKYNMQHLLARILFQKTSRAAFKFLTGIIEDARAYQHFAWVYAFRFLEVSLHLELSGHQDLQAALSHLKDIISMSSDYGDKTMLAIATTLEALTCLRLSSDIDSIEQAQRAIASVRSLQLDSKISELHQIGVLTSLVDLCCHLQHFDPNQVFVKMQVMQAALKNMEECKYWTGEGTFAIPIPSARMPSCKSRTGIVRKEEDGSLSVMFNWMMKDDMYSLGYLLSGVAMAHRNATDGQKSEHTLEEGIKKLEYVNHSTNRTTTPKSIGLLCSQQLWRMQIMCYMRLHIAFALCARTSWSAAKEQQSSITVLVEHIASSLGSIPEPLLLLTTYLKAVLNQGTGYLDEALHHYSSDILSLQSCRKELHPSQLRLDISLLSALNTLLIIRTPNHPKHEQLPSLLSQIEVSCHRNPNSQIKSAYHLVTASTSSSATILLTKQALQSALQTAKQSDNKQLMCMVLNFMSWKFFRGVVGDQAEKSARASQTLAQKCMDGLWTSVSAGVLGDTLEAAGRIEEAKKARQSGEMTALSLPEKLQEVMKKEREGEDVIMMDDGQELTMFGGNL